MLHQDVAHHPRLHPDDSAILKPTMREDLLFNALLGAIEIVLVGNVFRRRSGWAASTGLVVATLAAILLALGLSVNFFHLLRLLTFATLLHAPLLLAGMGWALRSVWRPAPVVGGLAALAVLVAAFDALVIEPEWLAVRHVPIPTPKLTRPVRIAVVADLQTDRIGDYEDRVLRTVVEAEPDLVLMPGDYVHVAEPARYRRLAGELRDLLRTTGFQAPLGCLAVRGNVDRGGWTGIFDGTAVTALEQTTSISVGELRLTALDLDDSFRTSLVVPPSDAFHVVFGHAPDFALGSIDADLLVAGHTHGGQVQLPFLGPVITFSRVPRTWASGVTHLSEGRTLVVSRGIGMERGRAPRIRFGCRPEIILIDLVPTGTAVHVAEGSGSSP